MKVTSTAPAAMGWLMVYTPAASVVASKVLLFESFATTFTPSIGSLSKLTTVPVMPGAFWLVPSMVTRPVPLPVLPPETETARLPAAVCPSARSLSVRGEMVTVKFFCPRGGSSPQLTEAP